MTSNAICRNKQTDTTAGAGKELSSCLIGWAWLRVGIAQLDCGAVFSVCLVVISLEEESLFVSFRHSQIVTESKSLGVQHKHISGHNLLIWIFRLISFNRFVPNAKLKMRKYIKRWIRASRGEPRRADQRMLQHVELRRMVVFLGSTIVNWQPIAVFLAGGIDGDVRHTGGFRLVPQKSVDSEDVSQSSSNEHPDPETCHGRRATNTYMRNTCHRRRASTAQMQDGATFVIQYPTYKCCRWGGGGGQVYYYSRMGLTPSPSTRPISTDFIYILL